MSSFGSITFWIQQLKSGERAAVQALWENYFRRLMVLARTKLRGAPRQLADEEDVALSAFDSFCRAVEIGRFPRLEDRDELWQILVMLASRKAINLAKRELAHKRGGQMKRVVGRANREDSDQGSVFGELIGREPDPGLAAEVAEHCQRLLGQLDPPLAQIALWKLEGYSNEEIAEKMGRAVATVERKLKRIRETWQKELMKSSE
jgi:DNA-directed RNA polymerase specialized sigma24 family protein